jgi:uroporphyrinogen-III synthase
MRPSVLVIRRNDRFSELLREAGLEVKNLELIATRPVPDSSDLSKKLERLDEYDGIFFTSPAAAEVFVERVKADSFLGKIYVLGERARKIFGKKGRDVIFRSDANTAEDLIASFGNSEFEGKRFLFVRGDRSMRTIPELLTGTAVVDEVIVYETVAAEGNRQRIEQLKAKISRNQIGWVCFFSPSAAEEFTRVFDRIELGKVKSAAIGETTAREARRIGISVEFVSKGSNPEDFAQGLIEHINSID